MKQKRILIVSFLLTCVLTSLFAKGDAVLEEFNSKLDSIGLEFKMPSDFVPVALYESKREDVDYFYAIRHKTKKVEIRYSIFPYKKSIKEPNHVEIGSDGSYEMLSYTVAVNIAGDDKNITKSGPMKEGFAESNFNADWGYIAFINPDSAFGEGYKKVIVIGLYKKEFGHSYHTILYDDSKVLDEVFQPALYSVIFKDKK